MKSSEGLNERQQQARGPFRQRHPFVNLKRKIRLTYLKILRIDDPPERIARGAAIGVAVGVLPTFGIGIIFSLAFAVVFNANKAASVLGGLIMNPLTSPIFLAMSVFTGAFIMGKDYHAIYAQMAEKGFLSGAGSATLAFMAGNLVITAVSTIASYYIVRNWVIRHRRKKEEKRLKKAGLKQKADRRPDGNMPLKG